MRKKKILQQEIFSFGAKCKRFAPTKNWYIIERHLYNWKSLSKLLVFEAFLSHLVVKKNVAVSTQDQAFNALLFLYRVVLEMPFPTLNDVVRSKRPQKLPVVMSKEEVRAVFLLIPSEYLLICKIIYGSGLRVKNGVFYLAFENRLRFAFLQILILENQK